MTYPFKKLATALDIGIVLAYKARETKDSELGSDSCDVLKAVMIQILLNQIAVNHKKGITTLETIEMQKTWSELTLEQLDKIAAEQLNRNKK